MKDVKPEKNLSTLESFFQFDVNILTEKQKNLYSVVALISSFLWLVLSLIGIFLGLIWLVLISTVFFKIVNIGLKSNKKTMSIFAIILYAINTIYWILVMWLKITGNI